MKTYTHETSLRYTNDLINYATDIGCDIYIEEGVLNDTTFIWNTKNVSTNKIKPRKYIICHYKYQTEWSNKLYITYTDSYEDVLRFAKEFGVNQEDIDTYFYKY